MIMIMVLIMIYGYDYDRYRSLWRIRHNLNTLDVRRGEFMSTLFVVKTSGLKKAEQEGTGTGRRCMFEEHQKNTKLEPARRELGFLPDIIPLGGRGTSRSFATQVLDGFGRDPGG